MNYNISKQMSNNYELDSHNNFQKDDLNLCNYIYPNICKCTETSEICNNCGNFTLNNRGNINSFYFCYNCDIDTFNHCDKHATLLYKYIITITPEIREKLGDLMNKDDEHVKNNNVNLQVTHWKCSGCDKFFTILVQYYYSYLYYEGKHKPYLFNNIKEIILPMVT